MYRLKNCVFECGKYVRRTNGPIYPVCTFFSDLGHIFSVYFLKHLIFVSIHESMLIGYFANKH